MHSTVPTKHLYRVGIGSSSKMRMRREGWRVVSASTSKMWHKVSRSSGAGSPLMYYYMTRNQLFFFSKYFPLLLPVALTRAVLRITRLVCLGRWVQVKAAFTGCVDWVARNHGPARKSL